MWLIRKDDPHQLSPQLRRKQAELCAQLGLISTDPLVIARHNTMALEHLARAVEVDAGSPELSVHTLLGGDGGSDMDRD